VTWGARVLGELALTRDGRPVELPASRRARLLLAWLAVHPGVHPRADVAARLRPDVLEESERTSLRQAAWALRPLLGPVLVSERTRIGLAEEAVSVDLLEFHRRVAAGDAEGALALSTGDVLVGLDEPWIDELRSTHSHEVDALLEQMSRAPLRPGARPARDPNGHDRAVKYTRERIARDPLSEPAHRELMRLLALGGDRAGRAQRLPRAERPSSARAASRALSRYAAARRRDSRQRASGGRGALGLCRSGARQRHDLRAAAVPWRLAAVSGAEFLGRRQELALAGAVVRERLGGPRALVVPGEPGIGKTRLVAEIARRVYTDGATVLYGRCEDDGVPYQPWIEVLAQCGRVLEHPTGDPEGARLRLYAALADALRAITPAGIASQVPLCVVIDDLHWADRTSLCLLAHLLRGGSAPERPAMLALLTLRDTEPGELLPDLLAEMRKEPGIERLALRGLPEADVGRLAASLIGHKLPGPLISNLCERTGGVPYYVEQLLRSLGDEPMELPAGVREVLERRMHRLGPGAALALRTAAVIGGEFRADVVDRAGGNRNPMATLDALEAAAAAGLLTEAADTPNVFMFAHALVRETVLAGLGATRRAHLHAAVADALIPLLARERTARERVGSTDAGVLGAVARHYAAAASIGRARDAVAYGWRAARVAADNAAWEVAAEHLERVNATLPLLQDKAEACPEQIDVLLELGRCTARAGNRTRALETFRQAASLARAQDDPRALAEAVLGISGVAVTILDVDAKLIGELEQAIKRLQAPCRPIPSSPRCDCGRNHASRSSSCTPVMTTVAARVKSPPTPPRRRGAFTTAVARRQRSLTRCTHVGSHCGTPDISANASASHASSSRSAGKAEVRRRNSKVATGTSSTSSRQATSAEHGPSSTHTPNSPAPAESRAGDGTCRCGDRASPSSTDSSTTPDDCSTKRSPKAKQPRTPTRPFTPSSPTSAACATSVNGTRSEHTRSHHV